MPDPGYSIGCLILLRLLWGLVGPRHARFADFVFSPATVLAYGRDLLHGQASTAVRFEAGLLFCSQAPASDSSAMLAPHGSAHSPVPSTHYIGTIPS
jgi:hypothetical protein